MVKRLRLSPLTAATGVRIPLESPSNQFRALFGARFLLGISPLFCVSLCDPQQAARSRALRSLQGESTWSHHLLTITNAFTFVFFYKPLLCVSLRDPQQAARSRALRSLKGDSPWSHHLLINTDVFDVRFFYLILGKSHPCYAFRFATRTGCTLARFGAR